MTAALALFFVLTAHSGYASSCSIVSKFKDSWYRPEPGVITTPNPGEPSLWAHEVTGWDLIKAERLNRPRNRVPIAIGENIDPLDLPLEIFDPESALSNTRSQSTWDVVHGTAVLHIILNQEIGLAAPGRLVAFTEHDNLVTPHEEWKNWTPADHDFFKYLYQGSTPAKTKFDFSDLVQFSNQRQARLINLSVDLGNWKPTVDQFASLSALPVTSAGNDPTDPINYKLSPVKERIQAVVVGGISKSGTQYGTTGPAVDILAPIDIPSFLPKGSRKNGRVYGFGLTSGATPIVTASLINVLNQVPELDNLSLETLLKRTSITTRLPINYVNSYKLARVAERIRRRMSKGNSSALEMINRRDIYDFSKEAAITFQKAQALSSNQTSCGRLGKAIQLARKAFLLDQKPEYREFLSQWYGQDSENAELSQFYR